MDKAHQQTNKILSSLEKDLTVLYFRANKKIQDEIEPLIREIYLENGEATPAQRLKHAERDGKKEEVIKKFVDIIASANEQTAKKINDNQLETYRVNFKFASDNIIEQIKDSMNKGGN